MNKPFYKRIWFILLCVLIIGIAVGGYLVSSNTNSIIEDNLRIVLEKNPNRLYKIDFRKLRVSPMKGNFTIHDITITPNQKALDSLDKIGTHQSLLADVNIASIKFKGIDIDKLINEQIIQLDEFEINNPSIIINITGYKKEKKDTVDIIESLYRIAEKIQNLQVNSISIKNANLLVSKNAEKFKDTIVIAQKLSLKVQNLKVDTANEKIPIDLNEMNLKAKYVWVKLNKVYDLEANNINSSFKDSSISIASFDLIPKITKEKFSSLLKYEKTWQKISCKEIHIVGFDIDDFLFKNRLHIRKVELNNPYIYVYKDKTPKWPSHLKHTLPSAQLKQLKLDLNVEQIILKNGEVYFEQKRPDRNSIGKFKLTEMFATVYNITNNNIALEKNNWLTLDAQMKIMGRGKMKANLKFDYSSRQNNWFLNASIGKMQLNHLNPIIYPLTDVELLAGNLSKVDVIINANEKSATGTMDMVYDNAKININKFNNETGEIQEQGIISFVANNVIRTTNIKGRPAYKQGHISYARTSDIPFIKFLWSSLQTGLIDTFIGLKNKEERAEKKNVRNSKTKKWGRKK